MTQVIFIFVRKNLFYWELKILKAFKPPNFKLNPVDFK